MSAGVLSLLAFSGAALALLLFRAAVAGFDRYLTMHRKLAETDLVALFIFLDGARLAWATLAVALLMLAIATLCGLPWGASLGALVAGLCAPRLLVQGLRRRRQRLLYEQLPDALGVWAGLLASGQGLHPALAQLAEHQPRPLGEELRVLVRQCRMGVPLETAVDDLCRRVGLSDLALVATLLRVSRELGGNLGESLQRLAELLRTRLAMEARIRSLTSQGRLQGVIVGALPIVLLLVLSVMEPEAMAVLLREPLGWAAMGAILALETVGFILIRRIVSIDV